MGTETSSEANALASVAGDAVSNQPSGPDRASIDDDVRARLGSSCEQWVVFERDSSAGDFASTALRRGVVFASIPSYRPEVLEATSVDGLPPGSAATPLRGRGPGAHDSAGDGGVVLRSSTVEAGRALAIPLDEGPSSTAGEPSNLIVARDLHVDACDEEEQAASSASSSTSPSSVLASARRLARFTTIVAMTAALAGVVTAAGVSASGLSVSSHAHLATGTADEVQDTSISGALAPPAEDVQTEPNLGSSPPAPVVHVAPTEPKKQLGKLIVKGEAARKKVWFDGKLLLGAGPRRFPVVCGTHTIAIADKTDAREVDVPCLGEYTLTK